MMKSEHYLVVIDPENDDYEIEHPEDCPKMEGLKLADGTSLMLEDCSVGREVQYSGLDCLGFDWHTLAPGRYKIRAWAEHIPSLPSNGGEEWDSGLEIYE